MAGPIKIAILAQAIAAQKGIRKTGEDLQDMGKKAEKADKPTSKISDTIGKLTKNAAGAVKSIGAAVAPIGAVANAALAAGPAVGAAAGAILNVARAAGGAAPALAAVAAAGIFVKLTMAAIAPAIAKSLEPVAKAFDRAGAAAGKLASAGVRPLAKEFAKVGIPIVADNMNRIATATNKVVKGFLAWANSSTGLTALRQIATATSVAFADVAPHVLALATALGEMIGRIAGVSLAAGSSGLSRILDLLTAKIKTITGESVQRGFDGLKSAFLAVRDTVVKVAEVVGVAISIYRKYTAEIKLISDVLGVLAIVFGGPVTAIIAAVGLVVRHLDFIKAAIAQVRASFAVPGNIAFLDNIRTAVAAVWPAIVSAFTQIRAAVMPTLIEITQKVRTELVPALGEFIAAAAPVVAFFIEKFAPIIAAAFKTIAGVISGAITVISGIFKVFTGLLHGNWAETWEGIKTIVRGAVGIIKSVLSGFFTAIKALFSAAKGAVSGLWSGLWSLVVTAAQAAARNVGTAISGLVAAVKTKFTDVKNAISDRMNAAVAVVKTAAGKLKSALNIDLYAAGAKIIQSLVAGIESRAGAVIDKIQGIAQSIRDYFPFSPAKRGPLKRKPMFLAGRNIVRDLNRGMNVERLQSNAAASIAGGLAKLMMAPNLQPFTASAAQAQGRPFVVNFNGIVGDPVATGKQVEWALNKYRMQNGRGRVS